MILTLISDFVILVEFFVNVPEENRSWPQNYTMIFIWKILSYMTGWNRFLMLQFHYEILDNFRICETRKKQKWCLLQSCDYQSCVLLHSNSCWFSCWWSWKMNKGSLGRWSCLQLKHLKLTNKNLSFVLLYSSNAGAMKFNIYKKLCMKMYKLLSDFPVSPCTSSRRNVDNKSQNITLTPCIYNKIYSSITF